MTRDANDKRILVSIKGGNLRNEYMYLTPKPGFFPRESYGASNRKNGVGRALTLVVKGLAEPVETDLSPRGKDGTSRCFFRNQGRWLGKFFSEHHIREGDVIAVEKTGRFTYRVYPFETKQLRRGRRQKAPVKPPAKPRELFETVAARKPRRPSSIPQTFAPGNRVTIYHGDCLDFLKTLPDHSVRLVVTSPPYNIGKSYEKPKVLAEYVRQQQLVIDECARALADSGSICWEIGNWVKDGQIIPLDILLYDCFRKHRFKLRNRIVWHFRHGLHCSKRFSGRYETILWFTKTDDYTFNLDEVRVAQRYPGKRHFKGAKAGELSGNPKGKNPSDVWDIPNVKCNHIEKTSHPCQFPIALCSRLIRALTNKDDLVFDPFLGVGTITAAAVLEGRRSAGAETDCKYYKTAVKRTKDAMAGRVRYREDIPTYDPPKGSKLTTRPLVWESDAEGIYRPFNKPIYDHTKSKLSSKPKR